MDKDIRRGLQRKSEEDFETAIVTIAGVLGSTPRNPGAKMLVFADGSTIGTIGGGCGEAEARREALNVLAEHTSKKHNINMLADEAEDEGMVCGGIMSLFIDYLGPRSIWNQALVGDYLAALEDGSQPVLATVIDDANGKLIGKKLFVKQNGSILGDLGLAELNLFALEKMKQNAGSCQPVLVRLDSKFNTLEQSATTIAYELMIEPLKTEFKLLILGGGHIALPLATMAKILGYEVTVVDDRPSFANSRRFTNIDRVICADFQQALAKMKIDPQTYVVIITRGHRHDKVCLKQVIAQPAGYIGMIGSRHRVKAMISELTEDGISPELLQKLHSPIGLKIGADTPEEIAVSIISELIKVQKETKESLLE